MKTLTSLHSQWLGGEDLCSRSFSSGWSPHDIWNWEKLLRKKLSSISDAKPFPVCSIGAERRRSLYIYIKYKSCDCLFKGSEPRLPPLEWNLSGGVKVWEPCGSTDRSGQVWAGSGAGCMILVAALWLTHLLQNNTELEPPAGSVMQQVSSSHLEARWCKQHKKIAGVYSRTLINWRASAARHIRWMDR